MSQKDVLKAIYHSFRTLAIFKSSFGGNVHLWFEMVFGTIFSIDNCQAHFANNKPWSDGSDVPISITEGGEKLSRRK